MYEFCFTALVARSLVFATYQKELMRPCIFPSPFPLPKRLLLCLAVLHKLSKFQMKLLVKELARAKADAWHRGFEPGGNLLKLIVLYGKPQRLVEFTLNRALELRRIKAAFLGLFAF